MMHMIKMNTRFFSNLAKTPWRNTEHFGALLLKKQKLLLSTSSLENFYNKEEKDKILKIINAGTLTKMKKYNISTEEIKELLKCKDEVHSFKSIEEVFQLPNLNSDTLNKFFQSIIRKHMNTNSKLIKIVEEYISCVSLPPEVKKNIQTCTGIWICRNYISWAQLDRECNLLHWDCCPLENFIVKDTLVHFTNDIAKVISQVPISDAYVLEMEIPLPFSRLNANNYYVCLHKQRIVTSIVSILGTRTHFYPGSKNEEMVSMNNIYMIRPKITARMHNLLIGTEVVCAQEEVDKLLTKSKGEKNEIETMELPHLLSYYNSRTGFDREQMNWALLVTSTFMKIVILTVPEITVKIV